MAEKKKTFQSKGEMFLKVIFFGLISTTFEYFRQNSKTRKVFELKIKIRLNSNSMICKFEKLEINETRNTQRT